MRLLNSVLFALLANTALAETGAPLKERATQFLADFIRLDTTNPPGNETRAAEYLKKVADTHGIAAELVGPDKSRLNFIARLKGSEENKPLLLIAHTDVVPADRSQWTVDPYIAA